MAQLRKLAGKLKGEKKGERDQDKNRITQGRTSVPTDKRCSSSFSVDDDGADDMTMLAMRRIKKKKRSCERVV